jgi:hypothetical protein
MGTWRWSSIGALIRVVFMDLHGPMENLHKKSCKGSFLRCSRDEPRSFHDLLRQKPSPVHIIGMELHCLPDDTIHTSGFGEENAGVTELDASSQADVLF